MVLYLRKTLQPSWFGMRDRLCLSYFCFLPRRGHLVGLLDPATLLDRFSFRRAAAALGDPHYRWQAQDPASKD
jgi:hypothetical protein